MPRTKASARGLKGVATRKRRLEEQSSDLNEANDGNDLKPDQSRPSPSSTSLFSATDIIKEEDKKDLDAFLLSPTVLPSTSNSDQPTAPSTSIAEGTSAKSNRLASRPSAHLPSTSFGGFRRLPIITGSVFQQSTCNQSREPHMNRLRNTMNALIDEATKVQEQGTLFNPMQALNELNDAINSLMNEHRKRRLEYEQIKEVTFASKFARFIDKLKWIRLRSMNDEELANLNKLKPVQTRPAILKKGDRPPNTQLTLPDAPPADEPISTAPTDIVSVGELNGKGLSDCKTVKEEDIIKEEPLCEVDDTPLTYGGNNPSTATSFLEKEIKEEEPDEEPSTSAQPVDSFAYLSYDAADGSEQRLLLQEAQPNQRGAKRTGAPQPHSATKILKLGTPRIIGVYPSHSSTSQTIQDSGPRPGSDSGPARKLSSGRILIQPPFHPMDLITGPRGETGFLHMLASNKKTGK